MCDCCSPAVQLYEKLYISHIYIQRRKKAICYVKNTPLCQQVALMITEKSPIANAVNILVSSGLLLLLSYQLNCRQYQTALVT